MVSDHTITASFTTITQTITASAGAGGAISPAGSVVVYYGTDQPFTITPDTGYHITDVEVDGVSNGTISSYTFTNVVADHTISASFAIDSFNLTSSASPGGTIIPNGTIVVTYNATQSFTMIPNLGKNIVAVMVDGTDQGPVSSYTFTNIDADHTIAASFTDIKYTITSSAGTGRPSTPRVSIDVYYGTNQTFTITNNYGYYIADVSVDGSSVGAVPGSRFTNVQASHTISASFATNPVITAWAGANGAIYPFGAVSVDYGTSQIFTITPNAGYSVSAVTVDGISQGAITSYTFTNVQGPHTISATFVINTYTITSSARTQRGHHPQRCDRCELWRVHGVYHYAEPGYYVADVTVDSVSKGSITSYTFTNVQASHTISATFASIPVVTGRSPISRPDSGRDLGSDHRTGSRRDRSNIWQRPADSYTFNSDTSITATSPAGSVGTVDITVTNPGGTSTTSSADHSPTQRYRP